jgi:predicted RNA methylase
LSEQEPSWDAITSTPGASGKAHEVVRQLFDDRRARARNQAAVDVREISWPPEALECESPMLARAYELRTGNDDRRKATGAFYTPEAVARELIEFASNSRMPSRMLDPACGCGSFLVAAAEWMRANGMPREDIPQRLHGVDVDPVAVEISRGRLAEVTGISDGWEARVVVGDSLAPAPPLSGAFDLIVGNPPFGNAIEARTGRTDAQRTDYAARFPEAATGAYDRACLFVEAALRGLEPDGRLAFIVPRALLSAPYAERLRSFITEKYRLEALRSFSSSGHFASAAVYVTALVVASDRRRGELVRVRDEEGEESVRLPATRSWAPLLSEYAFMLDGIGHDWPTVGEFFTVQASAAAGEAYEIQPHLLEVETPGAWRLLTTGSIDPFVSKWGTTDTRYLKQIYRRPWVPREAVSSKRAALYDSPKVLVAGLSKVLEAFADVDGSYAGAVATLAVRPRVGAPKGALSQIEIFLNSWLARTQFLALHGTQALGGGSVQVTKGKLAELRFPPRLLESSIARPSSGGKSLPSPVLSVASVESWDAAVLRCAWGADWIDTPERSG